MQAGAITDYIDVAQLALYGFFIFFAGLVYYLRTEDKREGFPLVLDEPRGGTKDGFPPIPSPKRFLTATGHEVWAPRREVVQEVNAAKIAPWPGAPLQPLGNPMRDAVGPAAFALRDEEPDKMFQVGLPKIVPFRVANDYYIAEEDVDPRGLPVVAADGQVAGIVRDVWVDRSEMVLRYLEVELPDRAQRVLLPMTLAVVSGTRRRVFADSVTAAQFAGAPGRKNLNEVTLREEDQIGAYFASGHLYAGPMRLGPAL